jgi:glyoxylase-like metal-dependent hydrolase (beta-lactamase superfamily II)
MSDVTVVNAGYRSTNYWVVGAGGSRILVDLGWPGTMGQMRANLARMDVPIEEIVYGLATHYHVDHAGLAQELKLAGVPLLVMDVQVSAAPAMKQWTKPRDRFVDVTMHDNIVVACADSRPLMPRIGIDGEIVHTPGHSDDSVSLLLDNGWVFTGDLTPLSALWHPSAGIARASWRRLWELGARRVYPGHGPAHHLDVESLA